MNKSTGCLPGTGGQTFRLRSPPKNPDTQLTIAQSTQRVTEGEPWPRFRPTCTGPVTRTSPESRCPDPSFSSVSRNTTDGPLNFSKRKLLKPGRDLADDVDCRDGLTLSNLLLLLSQTHGDLVQKQRRELSCLPSKSNNSYGRRVSNYIDIGPDRVRVHPCLDRGVNHIKLLQVFYKRNLQR